MKTTLIIDDAVLKETKKHAAEREVTMSALVTQSLREYLISSRTNSGETPFRLMTYGQALSPRLESMTPGEMANLRDEGR
ncbi:hypothetical protein N9023_06690 [Opitutaceae bacterium]|nr:hypothetical protein [Opitutaceae bacterium]MDB4474679.1 hypothetical protein [Opitutaceae bacterium]